MNITNDELTRNLDRMGLKLPVPSVPGGSYRSVNIRGGIIYVAIQFPIRDGEFLYLGRLGKEMTTTQGYEALQLCALNALAQVSAKVGFGKVEGLNHIDVYFQSVEDGWDDSPKVADGASDLFVQALAGQGDHTRSLVGVHRLPRNFCAGLVCSFTLKQG